MNRVTYLLSTIFLSLLLFSSCKDEPEFSAGGSFRMPLDEGYIIKDGNNNLLSLTASYPLIKVSSIFSLTAKAPEIAYLGQFHDLVEIPLNTDEIFSSQATIHNLGGYLIKMDCVKPGQNSTEKCLIKLLIKEGPFYNDDAPAYLDIEYEIYR